MERIEQNRRNFKLRADVPNFELHGIKCIDGVVKFPSSYRENILKGYMVFDSFEQCETWLKNFKEKDMQFTPGAKMTKSYLQVESKSVEISDAEFDKMSKYMLTPEKFSPTDFVAFKANLANNIVDRDGDRFQLDVLKSFNKSIVGKSKLTGHDWWGVGEGRVYDSDIIKYTDVDEFLKTVGFTPHRKIVNHLEEILEMEKVLAWLQPKYYMHIVDQDQITRIGAGVIGDVSIGFRAANREKITDEDGNLKYFEFQNTKEHESEALEMSHVYLGAQYGAQGAKYFQGANFEDTIPAAGDTEWDEKYVSSLNNECFAYFGQDLAGKKNHALDAVRLLPHHRKGAKGTLDDVDIPRLKAALVECFAKVSDTDLDDTDRYRYSEALKHLQAHAKELNLPTNYGEKTMPFTLKMFGDERKFDLKSPEDIEAFVKDMDSKFDELNTGLTDAKQAVADVKAALDLGEDDDFDFDAIKALKGDSEARVKYHDDLVQSIAALAFNTGQKEFDELEEYKGSLKEKSFDDLVAERKSLRDQYAKDNKGDRQIDPETPKNPGDENNSGNVSVTSARPNSSFQRVW